ncbi:MAG: hypothetical protein QOF19_1380 [Alphaproteobacteria bacterium]|jgi:hypothetical protein|nr:hypothetical protein [Alphaproteobacteria bacterium]
MSMQMILLPLFVEVSLTLVLLYLMGWRRGVAFRNKEVRVEDISLREPNWPPRASQAAYAFSNQFELPVLFYVLTILSIITRHADLLFVLLAWVFVVLRVLQAWVYVTSNNIRFRGMYYFAGAIVLTTMWVIFMVRILLGIG